MESRQLEKKDKIQRVNHKSPEASVERQLDSGRLGCGTLIVIFLLVGIAGKFLPHEGQDPLWQHSMPKGEDVVTRFGHFARSLSHNSPPNQNLSAERTGSQHGPETSWESLLDFFRSIAARLQQIAPTIAPITGKLREWQEGVGQDKLFKPMAAGPRSEKKTAKITPPAHHGAATRDVGTVPAPSGARKNLVFNNPWDNSVDQVVRYLKRHTHDADSMEFLEWGKVKALERGYQVRCRFRSRNVLGHYAVQNKLFLLDKEGNILDIMD